MTLIDGNLCNGTVGNKSAQVYYASGAYPTDMTSIDIVQQRPVDHNKFAFGICVLQAWVHFLERLSRTGYRMDFKKCQCDGKEQDSIKTRKETIQKRFRVEAGLTVNRNLDEAAIEIMVILPVFY
jgi:hypothetical protein